MSFKFSTPLLASVALIAAFSTLSAPASAALPGKHPSYERALTDLRDARWKMEHQKGDAAVSGQEDVAITETNLAITAVKVAIAQDGQPEVDTHPVDANLDHASRLRDGLELLRKAKHDVSQEEDNPESREQRSRVNHHVDLAIKACEQALHDVQKGK